MTNKEYDAVFTKPATTKLMDIHKESSNWYFIETLREITEKYCQEAGAPIIDVLQGYISDIYEHRKDITINEFLSNLAEYCLPYSVLQKI